MKKTFVLLIAGVCLLAASCNSQRGQMKAEEKSGKDKIRLVTLDPGHYHAALVQKSMYEQVDPVVRVYAPDGPDVQNHLEQIQRFNERVEEPTCWQEEVYKGEDFLERMLAERDGDIVVLSLSASIRSRKSSPL